MTSSLAVASDSGASSSVTVVPEEAGAGGDAGCVTTTVAVHGNDFGLMYVCTFITEVVDEIPERILNGCYNQLIGYVRGKLDQ